jgi:hypothetical protein
LQEKLYSYKRIFQEESALRFRAGRDKNGLERPSFCAKSGSSRDRSPIGWSDPPGDWRQIFDRLNVDCVKFILGMLGQFLHFSMGFVTPRDARAPQSRTIGEFFKHIEVVSHGGRLLKSDSTAQELACWGVELPNVYKQIQRLSTRKHLTEYRNYRTNQIYFIP